MEGERIAPPERREERIVDALLKGKSYREIAKELHVSFSEISRVAKRLRGEPEAVDEEAELHARAFELYEELRLKNDVNLVAEFVKRLRVSYQRAKELVEMCFESESYRIEAIKKRALEEGYRAALADLSRGTVVPDDWTNPRCSRCGLPVREVLVKSDSFEGLVLLLRIWDAQITHASCAAWRGSAR